MPRPLLLPPFAARTSWLEARGHRRAVIPRADTLGLTLAEPAASWPGAPVLSRAPTALGLESLVLLESIPDRVDRFQLGSHTFEARRPLVMAILNVTPDSFSDGGRLLDPELAIGAGLAYLDAGADLLDIGGESTRPGAAPVDPEAELRRVLPVVEGLHRARPEAILSIDTRHAVVAAAALAGGATIVNDVTAGQDAGLAAAASAAQATVILGHIRGTPATMQANPHFDDVVFEVAEELASAVERFAAAGVARARVLIDPGIGFGKRLEHNLELIRALPVLRPLSAGVVLGASRKRFLGELTGESEPGRRLAGSLAAVAAAAAAGAAIVRVHDVRETVDFLKVRAALTG